MSSNNNSSTSSGVGIAGLLGVAFVVLKLTGYIDWSWWWVTAPFWIPTVVVIAILIVFAVIALMAGSGGRR